MSELNWLGFVINCVGIVMVGVFMVQMGISRRIARHMWVLYFSGCGVCAFGLTFLWWPS